MSTSKWKPYPEYKESEMKWESSIPKKWKKVRLRFLGKTYGGLTGKKGEDFSKENSSNFKPYIPYTNILNQTYISKNHFDYVLIGEGERQNLAKSGDLFFLMSSESYQDLGKSSILIDDIDELYLNSFCKGFRVSESMIDPLFLNYQLQGHLHKQLISTEGKGFTRINLSQERLLDTPIFIPSISEQEQITNFLDTKIPMINHAIEQLEDSLSILEQKRSALITQAVTKGLNSNVSMKDSGFDWIGDIPNHWQTSRLNQQFTFKKGRFGQLLTASFLEDSEAKYPVYSGQTKDGGVLGFWNEHEFNFPDGVIFSTTVGAKCMSTKWIFGKFSLSQNCMIMIPKEVNIDSKYGEYFLRYYFVEEKKKLPSIMQPSLRFEDLNQFQILLPPIEEQRQISTHLDSVETRIDDIKDSTNKQIKRLNECRIALISAAVTGKIDVRESV